MIFFFRSPWGDCLWVRVIDIRGVNCYYYYLTDHIENTHFRGLNMTVLFKLPCVRGLKVGGGTRQVGMYYSFSSMPGQTAVLLECVCPNPCAFFMVAVCTVASLQEWVVGYWLMSVWDLTLLSPSIR